MVALATLLSYHIVTHKQIKYTLVHMSKQCWNKFTFFSYLKMISINIFEIIEFVGDTSTYRNIKEVDNILKSGFIITCGMTELTVYTIWIIFSRWRNAYKKYGSHLLFKINLFNKRRIFFRECSFALATINTTDYFYISSDPLEPLCL